jgi:hypothetical protein
MTRRIRAVPLNQQTARTKIEDWRIKRRIAASQCWARRGATAKGPSLARGHHHIAGVSCLAFERLQPKHPDLNDQDLSNQCSMVGSNSVGSQPSEDKVEQDAAVNGSLDPQCSTAPRATMVSMAATAARGLETPRQHRGNSHGVSSSRASTVDSAPCSAPVAVSVTARQENGPLTDEIGLPEPYRYGDSNPGFRTENRKFPN